MIGFGLLHELLYWAAVAVLVSAVMSFWTARLQALSNRLVVVGFVLLTACIVPRWMLTGHPPILGTYENTIAAVWFLSVALIALLWSEDSARHDLARALAVWVIPLLALGWFFDRSPLSLPASARGLFVEVHVLFSWTALTFLLIASTAAIMVLVRPTGEDNAEWWDAVMVRSVGFGFTAFTLMLVAGATYSYLLFGDWYRWEIVGTLAAALWLSYASTLHAAMIFSWRGRRLASVMLLVLPLMLATFWVWSFYSGTYHHFEIQTMRQS